MTEREKGERRSDELFRPLVSAFTDNVLRASNAHLGHLTIGIALPRIMAGRLDLTDEVALSLPQDLREGLAALKDISVRRFKAWAYVGDVSMLVYYTTLFDTFLQDVVEFLLCSFPGAMNDHGLSFRDVINAASQDDLVNEAIHSKVREVGFLSFNERLKWMKQQFGLKVDLSDDERAQLEAAAESRNRVVHDQGWLDFRVEAGGVVVVHDRGTADRPTAVTQQEIEDAKYAYLTVAVALVEAVYAQVLKCDVLPLRGVLDALVARPEEDA